MTDDLGRRLEGLATRLAGGKPDVQAVIARGKRTKIVRYARASFGALAVAAVATFAVSNLEVGKEATPAPPANHGDGVFKPAEPNEPTYVLTDFRIEYPWATVDGLPHMAPGSERRKQYCSMPDRNEACESEGNAGFLYRWHWATERYPGEVACRVHLFSADGQEVGRTDWFMSGLESRSRQPSDILVHVSAKPATAEASCEAGTLDKGPPHRFTFVRAELVDMNEGTGREVFYRNVLYFEVETLTEHSSGMCRSTIRYESGKKVTSTFTMTGAPREDKLFEIGAPYREGDPVKDGSVRCSLYKREARG